MTVVLVVTVLVVLFGSCHGPVVVFYYLPVVFMKMITIVLLAKGIFGFMTVIKALKLVNVLVGGNVILVSRVALRVGTNVRPIATLVSDSRDHLHPMVVTSLAAVLKVVPLLSSTVFNSLTTTVVKKLLYDALVALLFVPVLCTLFFGVEGS